MRLSIATLGLALTACYSTGEGITPPLDRVYFPVGLTTNCDQRAGAPTKCQATRLYVASSDFDLQYNAGSIQAIDLERVHTLLDAVYPNGTTTANCKAADLGTQTDAEQLLAPGPCRGVDLTKADLLVAKVGIGAFASDLILTTDLSGTHKRLLLPVRGEASLHWIDLDNADNELDCGQTDGSPVCDRAHRVGTDPAENTRNVRMPSEPYGIAVSAEGDAIAVTHQTLGQLSLFYQEFNGDGTWPDGDNRGPRLESITTLSSTRAVAIAAAPESQYVREKRQAWIESGQTSADPYPPGFLVTYADSSQIDLMRFYADTPSSPARPFLQGAAAVPLRANSGGVISRGITLDDSARRACDERDCAADSGSDGCKACANESVGVYVSSRSPASLLVGATLPGTLDTYSRDVPQFVDAMPVPLGASRVYVGKVLNDGNLETRIFVVCFDQRRIAIYDPKSNRIEGTIITGRGPHAMAFEYSENPPRAMAYVGHFTDSYIGVIDLNRSNLRTYGKIVMSLAERVAPRASK